jgi:hypothetical protein
MSKESLMDRSRFTGSNFFRAEDLEPGVLIETEIVAVTMRDFRDEEPKPVVYTDYQGKGLVLNITRARALYAAFGPNDANWIGKRIIIGLGETVFEGRKVGAVVVEPVVADRIAAPAQRAALGRGSTDIRSGKDAREGPKRTWEGSPSPDPDDPGPNDPNDKIPF